jgi:hypothetical protein
VIQIDNGKITANGLEIDTRRKDTPVIGRIDQIELNVSAQNISLDDKNKVRAATVGIKSNDVVFVENDPYPVGHMKVSGQVNGATVFGIGDIVISNASIDAAISRVEKDELRVDTASLDGLSIVSYGQNRRGNVKFKVVDARYYWGQGDGKLSMSVTNFGYDMQTPSGSEHPECCGDLGFKSDIDIKAITVKFAADPIQIDAEILSAAGKWEIKPKHPNH